MIEILYKYLPKDIVLLLFDYFDRNLLLNICKNTDIEEIKYRCISNINWVKDKIYNDENDTNTLYIDKYTKYIKSISLFHNINGINKYTNLEVLYIYYRTNDIIKPNDIPKSVKKLYFIDGYNNRSRQISFNQEIIKNILPNGLTHLHLNIRFNSKIHKGSLPETLTHLIFVENSYFNKKLEKDTLPNKLTHLTFGNCFNQEIDDELFPKTYNYHIYIDIISIIKYYQR